jgi:hypothetical protein
LSGNFSGLLCPTLSTVAIRHCGHGDFLHSGLLRPAILASKLDGAGMSKKMLLALDKTLEGKKWN